MTKRLMARTKDLTLIEVPYWWDGNVESLLASIQFQKPEVKSDFNFYSLPIPLNPLSSNLSVSHIPDVGELMLASFPTDPTFRVSMSEENSGWAKNMTELGFVGTLIMIYTRHGREITVLPKIQDAFPSNIFVDGEIWFGRGLFNLTYILLKAIPESVQWNWMRMVSFDNPSREVENEPFETRLTTLIDNIGKHHPFMQVVSRMKCTSDKTVNRAVQAVIDDEGEGIIMRKCSSLYEHGRTHLLVKLKASQGDQEAIVVDVGTDESVELKLPNGRTFIVPPQDVLIATPTKGEIVTFSYESYARRDLPVNPKIFRVRTDVSWDDVVMNLNSEKKFLNMSSTASSFTSHPLGHWNPQNMRRLLEDYAKNIGMDPLDPETWYATSSSDIREIKGGSVVLRKFSSYFETIATLFPEIKFDRETYRLHVWDSESKRRRFFELYARSQDFNPLVASNWYHQPRDLIMASRAVPTIIAHHNKSVSQALLDLFPEIGLDSNMFHWPKWKHSVAKKFFDDYAFRHSFNPLNPENWYSQSIPKILATKGASRVVMYYNNSLWKAIYYTYPNIGLDRAQFSYTYASPESRRKFFEEYARVHGFDPLLPENWYSQSFSRINAAEGASKVTAYHSGSIAKALLDLFSTIAIWSIPRNRREFFIDYAKQNGFDPKDTAQWYKQPKDKILSFKGASRVLFYHSNSVSKALSDLFPNYNFDRSKFVVSSAWHDAKYRKRFFEKYAAEKGFEPLIPENWYPQVSDILNYKGAKRVIFYHGDSVPRALIDLFPNVAFDRKKFHLRYREEKANRTQFFIQYAKDKEFDPLNHENWYRQSKSDLMAAKNGAKVLQYYNYSVPTALKDLFPSIGIDEQQFQSRIDFRQTVNRKSFLEQFARDNGFDPFIPENWYAQSKRKFLELKGAEMVLSYHKNSFKRALVELFPSIGLDINQFQSNLSHWADINNRRKFFEDYAAGNGFDVNSFENWKAQSKQNIMAAKGAQRVLFYHNSSINQALADLFPNMVSAHTKTSQADLARNIFEGYAKQHSFDSLQAANWYSQSITRMVAEKGMKQLLNYYDSIPVALMNAFPDISIDPKKFLVSQSIWNDSAERRKFFMEYANQQGFDPLIPENWHSQQKDTLMKVKGIVSVLSYHRNNVSQALRDLFPEIGLKKSHLLSSRQTWSSVENRRRFFEDYAKDNNFDPLSPDNWYTQPIENILATKGALRVVSYHKQNIQQALMDLFPDIGFIKSKFKVIAHWRDIGTRRIFFEQYAKDKGFDPRNPEKWYSQNFEDILSRKDATNVLVYHQNYIYKALMDLFPNIGLVKTKFPQKGLWDDIENRREFFENYAKEFNFDHLNPSNWYTQPFERIISFPGGKKVIKYHGNSVSKALMDLFPLIGLKKTLFNPSLPKWSTEQSRRELFINYAKEKGFDPLNPENWYCHPLDSILSQKGASGVIYYHKNKVLNALLDLFPDIGLERSRF